jgi:hypothetical protein
MRGVAGSDPAATGAMVSRMRILHCLAAVTLISCNACSGLTPTTPDPVVPAVTTPPTATVEAVVRDILNDLVAGVNTTSNRRTSTSPLDLSPRLLDSRPQAFSCNASFTQCQLFQQLDDRTACPGGGSQSISATLSGTISVSTNSSSGNFRWDGFQTYSDCTENGWVTNSNPYMNSGGTIRTTTSGNSSRTTMTLTLGGGFVMSNSPGRPNGRIACANSGVILQWDELTGWSNSGSLSCDNGLSFKY